MKLSEYVLEPLREDEEFILSRGRPRRAEAPSVLLLATASTRPAPESLKKLEHEYSFRNELDPGWAVRPLSLSQHNDQKVLVLENPGGEPLNRLIQGPMEMKRFLRFAIGLASALSQLHKRDLIHKDIKPPNVLVDSGTSQVWLMGFGIASRLRREHQAPEPPEFIAGTLPYMAPEQTGRMNRSIDSRSDLYALGVTLYEMLTGKLPFTAADPIEWVHSHIAKRPVPPHERAKSVPACVSAIVMKLLAKTPEERYQTAFGVESDLRRCLTEWEAHGFIVDFSLGQHDAPDRLLIPEKLYGRAREIETLLTAFDRVVAGGRPELVLVSGYSGIGKSAVVNELHKPLVPPRGLFAFGKFDQYKRDIPYATLAQAFQSLTRTLLSKSEEELSKWRNALHEALDPNGQLMVGLVPELKAIIGEQPPVPELPQREAQARFHLVFRRFINVFARPEHPLAVFLDDLQWLDSATLDLMEYLLTQPDVRHLLLIGAYRDNEVDPAHPLVRKLQAMRQAGALLQDIVLAPLTRQDLEQLIADSLHCELGYAGTLAELVHNKTTGNPFFAIQFISALFEESLLTFDHFEGRWSWDLNRIHAKGYANNVVDLVVRKLSRLVHKTQNALQQLACLGNRVEFTMLRVVYQDSMEEMHAQLAEAVEAGFIWRSKDSYHFLHDRVQEAAYSLIPEERRAEAHLRIGRQLAARTSPKEREHWIFEIVNQLNRGAALISSRDEKEQLAEFDLIAGKRAKASTAYVSALRYLVAGTALLADDGWVCRPDLMFPLEFHRAECEFLTGELAAAEKRLTVLASRAANTVERATVECLRIDLYTALDQADRGVASCLDYLRHLGIEWSPHPTDAEARREYERIWSQLGSRTIEQLIDLPLMNDPASLATLDVLTKSYTPAMFTDVNLLSMTVCRAVNLSLEQGHSDGSCVAYVFFAKIAGPHFNDYKAGFRFGQLGFQLVEKRGFGRFQARTSLWFAQFVVPWTKHIRDCRELMRRALEAATKAGDLIAAVYSFDNLNTNFLAAGDPLLEAQRQAENGLELAERAQFGHVIATQLGLIRTLRGLTYKFGCLDDRQFNEVALERHFAANPALKEPECQYWIRKLQARFFAGDYPSALDAAARAGPLLWTSASMFETAEYHFYAALSHAASCASAVSDRDGPASSRLAEDVPPSSRPTEYQQHFEALAAHQEQQEIWAKNCPENFENRAALVGAEIARIEGRVVEAERLYEQAIRSAHSNGFVNSEAIAYELAARFYAARGFQRIADAYLLEARYCYDRWGAEGKVTQLENLYPHLKKEWRRSTATSTVFAPAELLDLATVIKVSQTVSGEMVLEKLIDRLLRAALQQAGAERGLLITPRRDELQIEAEATATEGDVTVHLRDSGDIAAAMPESLMRYVMRAQENVILEDASSPNPFSADPYIVQRRPRSILTLPLINLNQSKLISILYLENNLTPHVFTPDRITVLKVLASQAATSLENTRLYRDLEDRERRIRRLVDANIMGIFSWNLDGQIVGANEAFLDMVQYDHEDVASGRVRWIDLTPHEWREHDEGALAELKTTGTVQPYEKEYFRKDGSRVPVLVAGALFEEGGGEGVAFALDLSEQKHAEEALRRSEAYLADAQKLSRTGSWHWNVSTGEVAWSQEYCAIFGFDFEKDKPSYQLFIERVHPEDRPNVERVLWADVRERRDFDGEYRLLLPDGSIKYLHSLGKCSLDQSGDVEYIGAVVDITEHKRAEQELRDSEERHRVVVEAASDAVISMDEDGVILLANAAALRVFGYDPTELIGQPLTLLMPEYMRKLHEKGFRSYMATGERHINWQGTELTGLRKNGQEFPVEISFGELIKDGHRIFTGFIRDISERKRAEDALRRSESYLAEAQRLTHIGSWAGNILTREIFHSSDEHSRLYGLDPESGIPSFEDLYQRVHPEDQMGLVKTFERASRDRIDVNVQYRIVLPDGTTKHVEAVGHPVLKPSGEAGEFIGFLMDVTERKRAEEEREGLRQARADLAHINRVSTMGELTASLAHEIKQPISAAMTDANSCSRWLTRDLPDVAKAQAAASRVVKDVARASEIIGRIGSLFKKHVPKRELIDVNELIREMIGLMRSEASRYSISIRSELADGLPQIMADRVGLQQVLMNLMLNGVEAMKDMTAPGTLTIVSRRSEDGELAVSILDTGVGVPPEQVDKIFSAFVTSKAHGTGMGLPISRSIIESHGGRLWATPNTEPGATFQFVLPIEPSAHQTA